MFPLRHTWEFRCTDRLRRKSFPPAHRQGHTIQSSGCKWLIDRRLPGLRIRSALPGRRFLPHCMSGFLYTDWCCRTKYPLRSTLLRTYQFAHCKSHCRIDHPVQAVNSRPVYRKHMHHFRRMTPDRCNLACWSRTFPTRNSLLHIVRLKNRRLHLRSDHRRQGRRSGCRDTFRPPDTRHR